MPGRLRASWADHDAKVGTLSLETYTPSQVEWAGFDIYLNELIAAMAAAVVGDVAPHNYSWSWQYEAPNEGYAASPLAQRENKWLCRYQAAGDPDSAVSRLELPCADLTKLTNNSEYLDLTAGDGLAFKTAFEALVVASNGLPAVLLSVKYVGRNT